MNLLELAKNQYGTFTNWVHTTPTNTIIDTVTYNQYESNNPFRRTFNEEDISNKNLRLRMNVTNQINAEIFSAFANPYYLSHKITSVPNYYQNVVDTYKNVSQNKPFLS